MCTNSKRMLNLTGVMVLLILSGGSAGAAGFVQPEELHQRDLWAGENLFAPQAKMLPFSFSYGGKPSAQLLAEWPMKQTSAKLDAFRTQHTRVWIDAKTGLEVRCVGVEYADYPAIEWTVYFKNTGTNDTPILEDIQGLDTTLQRTNDGEFLLHANKGDWDVADGYAPYQVALGPGKLKRFAPADGRPTNGPNGWPYYNVQMPGGGVLVAIGWPGQWAIYFMRDHKTGLRMRAGQEWTEIALKPGEEIRSPLIAMVFWQGGDVVRAQNLWRRWFMAHNIHRINGQPPAPMLQMQLGDATLEEAGKFAKAGIDIDLYWRDAGWYPCNGNWQNTGTWEVDLKRYPNGFKPIADWVHARGKKLIVWFEPESVRDNNSWLAKNHPEWLLSENLLNLGNPDAWKWVVEHIDTFIKDNGIDYYRQDFNMGPLNNWRAHDTDGRQGLTENLYVQGYLAYWDELQRRHPAMLIDSCSAGGRRNELEAMRRAVPLTRSDFEFPGQAGLVEGNQGHTYGLSSWLPYQGTGAYLYDAYSYRSFYLPCFGLGGLTPENTAAQQKAYAECRKIAPLMLGDYYPLTPYSLHLDQWIAWQFNRPEEGDGEIQAFRRAKCTQSAMTFKLSGLDAAAQYEVTNFDVVGVTQISGKDLQDKGLTVEITANPGAAVIMYKRMPR